MKTSNPSPESSPDANGRITGKRVRAKGPLNDALIVARTSLVVLQKENAELEKRRRELELGEAEGRLVEVARVYAAVEKCNARVRAMLDAAFRNELPARLGGLPSDQIALENGKRLDEIYAELSKPLA